MSSATQQHAQEIQILKEECAAKVANARQNVARLEGIVGVQLASLQASTYATVDSTSAVLAQLKQYIAETPQDECRACEQRNAEV